MASPELTARDLLHGEHSASSTVKEHPVVGVFRSHDTGIPCTTLVRGWTYDLYSSWSD